MKQNTHPKYYPSVTVRCACGAEFTTGSVLAGPISVEICASCHPFFTGEQKYIDTEGRVEKFQRKQTQATNIKSQKVAKIREIKPATQAKSLRELLEAARR